MICSWHILHLDRTRSAFG